MGPLPSPTSTWRTETYPSLSPTGPELSCKGKIVVVTGGGTGIGAETARYFAEAGAARIALLGRREQPLLDTKASINQKFPGVDVFVASTDITGKAEVDVAFNNFAGDGKIRVLVSNAGILGPKDPMRDVDGDKFVGAIETNLKGSLLVAQAFLRYASTEAVVINVRRPLHIWISVTDFLLTAFLSWLVNPEISFFHVQPGVVKTALETEAGGIEALGYQDNVNLPASFHVWLASPEARFLKNKFVWANWDVDELKAQAKEIETSTKLSIGLVGYPFENDSNMSQC
ncbi:hypothetical protein AJ79_02583 [Helicocarpus griseus UAMH5409]|uniref:Ketoreductase domain-containing protein n=1 Tax=Helicocarpus griseus UAMH5409 TaxID=1447875 RepID=A0A2B7Y306_9EURO|nr:hypothetical protein AJ79_02583 [Helicocarpus griseus UAMH5409]